MGRMGRFIDSQNIAYGATTTDFQSNWYGVGELEDLHLHVSGTLTNTAAGTATATINLWVATTAGQFGANEGFVTTNPQGKAYVAWSATLSGPAGGAATAESQDWDIGCHAATAANQVFFGSYIMIEVVMNANSNIGTGVFDLQGK